MTHFKVGDEVRITAKISGRYRRGRVISRDGSYVYVRLNAQPECVVECYDCELSLTHKDKP